MTDDWMNPHLRQQTGIEHTIERCRREITFGTPGYIDRWQWWSSHDSAKERDAALQELHQEHPDWHLRARDRNHDMERLGIFPPVSVPGINP